jgi:hypothetical protein
MSEFLTEIKYRTLYPIKYGIFYPISRGLYKESQTGNKTAIAIFESRIGKMLGNYYNANREYTSHHICLGCIFGDYLWVKEVKEQERVSDEAIRMYSNDECFGYAKPDLNGTMPITEQSRGKVIPEIEDSLKGKNSMMVVEIGTGNGDVIAYLAKKHPEHNFIGVDFSVKHAKEKHAGIGNASFMKGYALDLLNEGKLKGNILFGSSTFTIMLPKELDKYLELARKAGFTEIMACEPTWGGYKQENSDKSESFHMEQVCWYHNYAGYMRKHGYGKTSLHEFIYPKDRSTRPGGSHTLAHGTKATEEI